MKKKNLLLTAIAIFGLATITMAQTVPSYVPTSGLLGWWPFNGNGNDESGNGNNGTVNGATLTSDRFGNNNSAYNFTGSTTVPSYIEGDCSSFPTGNRTVSMWFYANDIGAGNAGRALFGYGGQTCGQSWLENIDNSGNGGNIYEVQGHCQNQQVLYNYGSTHPNGSWINWVITTDNTNGTNFYINGVNVKTDPTFINQTFVSGKKFIFGAYVSEDGNNYLWDGNCHPYNGKLDDIGIWNRALTQQEITDLYNGCQLSVNTQPTNQTINVNNNAQFLVSSSDTSATYQWQTDLGVGFQNLNSVGQYSGTTNDTLTVSNVTMSNNNQPFRCIVTSGSCSDTSNVAILTVNNNVGINENTQDNLFSVFPNPAESVINVKTDSKLIGDVYSIYDNTGRVVLTGKLNSQNTTIELGNLSGGIYMFSVGENMKQTFKVIKE